MAFGWGGANEVVAGLGIGAVAEAGGERFLYAAIFTGMKTEDSNPAIRVQDARQATEERIQGGKFVPLPFDTMIDPETGRTRVRSVDVTSTRYAIARSYMIRLKHEDFDDPHDLAKLAATAHLSVDEFRDRFGYLTDHESAPRVKVAGGSLTSFL